MGADYRAYAVIGCEIMLENIPKITEIIKAFNHNHPKNVKFDPETGKKLWKEDSYQEFAFEPDDDRTYDERTKMIDIGEFKIYRGTDGSPTVIGFGCGEDTYSNGGEVHEVIDLPDVNELKNKLKAILEPVNMWDEDCFGLHAILYCSY